MKIRIRETGQVMYEGEFRALFPNTSMPQQLSEELLNSFGADVVFEGPQATGGTVYQYSQASGVEQVNGKWYTKYILGPVFLDQVVDGVTTTAAEQEDAYKAQKDAEQARNARITRDQKLASTDWRFRSDMTPSQEWIDYCQALRDVPSQEGFPWNITWPVEP